MDRLEGTTVKTVTKPILAIGMSTTREALIVELESGVVAIPWSQCSPRLAAARETERCMAELSPSGYGIHWPMLDEDLAVGPLVGGCMEATQP